MIRQLWPLTLGAFVLGLDAFVLAGLLPGMAYSLGTTQASVGLGVAMFTHLHWRLLLRNTQLGQLC